MTIPQDISLPCISAHRVQCTVQISRSQCTMCALYTSTHSALCVHCTHQHTVYYVCTVQHLFRAPPGLSVLRYIQPATFHPKICPRGEILRGEIFWEEILRGKILRGEILRGEILWGEILRAIHKMYFAPQDQVQVQCSAPSVGTSFHKNFSKYGHSKNYRITEFFSNGSLSQQLVLVIIITEELANIRWEPKPAINAYILAPVPAPSLLQHSGLCCLLWQMYLSSVCSLEEVTCFL